MSFVLLAVRSGRRDASGKGFDQARDVRSRLKKPDGRGASVPPVVRNAANAFVNFSHDQIIAD
jgi:hypothetical protein